MKSAHWPDKNEIQLAPRGRSRENTNQWEYFQTKTPITGESSQILRYFKTFLDLRIIIYTLKIRK